MIITKYEILSEVSSGALLRLFNSRAVRGTRPLENHHHTMLEVSLIKRGNGVYTVGNRTYDIREVTYSYSPATRRTVSQRFRARICSS